MAAIKRFKVYFTGGLPPMITFGITRAQVARQIKSLYGPEMIDSIEPASKKSSIGMAFVPLPFNTTGKELKIKVGGITEALNKNTPTVEEIAKKNDVTVAEVEAQLKKGIAVEKEHTSNESTAREIALDHLGERLDYYTRLKMAEKLDLKKADMGTVIKDFQKSDAPQFKGKSDEKKREMAIAAKMNAEAMETKTLVTSMKETLASAFTLYLKSQNFHWNVQGPDFVQYHEFLGEYYGFVYGHVDKIAEQIRTLNAAAPGSMVSFKRMTKIMEDESIPSAAGMFSALAADNQTMMNVMQEARDLAESNGKTGLVNYLEGAIDEFAKYEWMFKSIGGNSITEALEVKNVKITSKSPDANKDGKVDAKDDLNKDGAVDAKDLKIAELEKDLKIKQLETEMDDLDDPVPEEEEPQINVPERPRIKDRGNHFEVMDHKGDTLKKFKYSHEEGGKSSREAREEARRFVSKWYHDEVSKAHASGKKTEIPMPEEFVRVTESSMVDGRTKAFKEAIKRLQFAKKQISEEEDVCPECNCYPCECDNVEEAVDPSHQKVLNKAKHATPRKPNTEYDRKVVSHLKKKYAKEEDETVSEDEVDEASLADMRAHFARQGGSTDHSPRLSAQQHAHHDQARRTQQARTQQTRKEDKDMNEGNAFIFAAAQAKQAGKKSFEFNGKKYKVKLKSHSISEGEEFDMDELEYMVESIDPEKLTMLARAGMVSKDQLATLKMAMQTMADNKPLRPQQREVIVSLFTKLADLATNDQAVFQKAKKFAKEDVEQVEEAVTVKKDKYSWGKMVTVHHGSDTSYPLHPEHQAAIKKLRPGMKTTFKDETNSTVHAHREGDKVHLHRPKTNTKLTTVPYHHFDEDVEQVDELSKTTLGSYVKKASNRLSTQRAHTKSVEADAQRHQANKPHPSADAAKRYAHSDTADKYRKDVQHARKASQHTAINIDRAKQKMNKEEVEMNEDLHPKAHEVLKHIKPEHRAKYHPDMSKKHYKHSYADRTAVLNAAKRAGHMHEEVEYTSADFYADYIKNTKR